MRFAFYSRRKGENVMKILKSLVLVLALSVAAYAQTEDLGMGAFANEKGPILVVVDAAMADLMIDSPYVMFVAYFAAKDHNQSYVIERKDVVMVYKGQEYHLPTVKELRENYRGGIHDVDFYRHLGKEGLIASWARFYNFYQRADFFPTLNLGSDLPVEQGSMSGFIGFRTKLYFKNPGFKKGDKLTIKVRDKKNPQVTGEVEVTID
jgi:hypothetical protein